MSGIGDEAIKLQLLAEPNSMLKKVLELVLSMETVIQDVRDANSA